MDFVCVDVETANNDRASICQIGVARFRNGCLVEDECWQSFVNPEDEFDSRLVGIHRIDEARVKDAPTFPQIASELNTRLSGNIVVSHMPFDRVALVRAAEKYGLQPVDCRWLDSAKIVRRTWPERSQRGYGLKEVAEMLGIVFEHHNAQEDARAAGEILLHAQKVTGLNLPGLFDRVRLPINPSVRSSGSSPNVQAVVNPEGHLFGEVVVFTGTLTLFTQGEAEQLAATVGCEPKGSVTSKTTMVVIGTQDVRKTGGHEKSKKHRTAEEKIEKGQPIEILTEADFLRLVEVPC